MNSILILGLFGLVAIATYRYTVQTFDYDVASEASNNGGAAAEAGFARLRIALEVGFALLVVVVPFVSYAIARQSLRPVRLAFEAQSRFVDDASHEFRNPLASIQVTGELALLKVRNAGEYELSIRDMLRDAASLSELTSGLLVLTRSDRSKLSKAQVPIRVEALVKAIVGNYTARDAVQFMLEPGLVVQGIPALLQSALANLVDNAVKFGEGRPIRVSARLSKGAVVIEVADQGVGMSDGERSRAFDRFWRAENARSKSGHGLGLSLVQHIAQLHDGTIILTRNDSVGTVARLILPMSGIPR